jgi:hypothetical protein
VKAHKDYSLWGSGVAAAELPAEEPTSDVDPERFPDGRITEEDARLWTIVETAISHVAVLCTQLKRAESSKPEPDQARLERWSSLQVKARRDRRSLDLDDHRHLERVIESYKFLARQLESEGE